MSYAQKFTHISNSIENTHTIEISLSHDVAEDNSIKKKADV